MYFCESRCSQRPEEGIGSPGAGVIIKHCEVPDMGVTVLKSSGLAAMAEPSFQSQKKICKGFRSSSSPLYGPKID